MIFIKNSLILVVVVLVLAASGVGGYFYLSQKSSKSTPLPTLNPNRTEDTMVNDKETMESDKTMNDQMGSGQYIEYSDAAFAAAAGMRRVLFFYANWCPTCRPADADFQAKASQFPEDVVVFRVNYNDTDTDAIEKALAEKYGVTYQHTFIQVDADEQEVTKWNGGQTAQLLSNLK